MYIKKLEDAMEKRLTPYVADFGTIAQRLVAAYGARDVQIAFVPQLTAATNGETIILPAIKEVDWRSSALLRGFLLHEVGHIRHSDLPRETYELLYRMGARGIANSLEDVRQENLLIKQHGGARRILDDVGILMLGQEVQDMDEPDGTPGEGARFFKNWVLTYARCKHRSMSFLNRQSIALTAMLESIYGVKLVRQAKELIDNQLPLARSYSDVAELALDLVALKPDEESQDDTDESNDSDNASSSSEADSPSDDSDSYDGQADSSDEAEPDSGDDDDVSGDSDSSSGQDDGGEGDEAGSSSNADSPSDDSDSSDGQADSSDDAQPDPGDDMAGDSDSSGQHDSGDDEPGQNESSTGSGDETSLDASDTVTGSPNADQRPLSDQLYPEDSDTDGCLGDLIAEELLETGKHVGIRTGSERVCTLRDCGVDSEVESPLLDSLTAATKRGQNLGRKLNSILKGMELDRVLPSLGGARINSRRLAMHNTDSRVFLAQELVEAKSVEVGILVDLSGSMQGVLADLKCAMCSLVQAISLVGCSYWSEGFYGSCITRIIQGNEAPGQALQKIAAMLASESTPTGEAVEYAAERFAHSGADQKHLIILTDGDPDCFDRARKALFDATKQGIKVSIIGYGVNRKIVKELLEDLTENLDVSSIQITRIAEFEDAALSVVKEAVFTAKRGAA